MDYKFLDSGEYRKLEQFGEIVVDRPAPFADWSKKFSKEVWNRADAVFKKEEGWIEINKIPEKWLLKIDDAVFNLKLSAAGQVGIFPEQLTNWLWLKDICSREKLRILNGFAYTGGSTIFPLLGNSENELTHVDAAKSAIVKAKENVISSNLQQSKIRWITDDIVKFMEREIKRNSFYDGVIVDPPAFGRTSSGKIWKLSKDIEKLFYLIEKILSEDFSFCLFSCHDPEIDKEILLNYGKKLVKGRNYKLSIKELNLKTASLQNIEMGMALRAERCR